MNRYMLLKLKNCYEEQQDWFETVYENKKNLDKLGSNITEFLSNYDSDTGFDIYCPFSVDIPPKSISFKLPLGIKTCAEQIILDNNNLYKIPSSFELWPRSSTGSKTPLRLSNSIGLVDPQYRGEIMAIIDNLSNETYNINRGDRLFQLVAPGHIPIVSQSLTIDEELSKTDRGEKGFGSTGK